MQDNSWLRNAKKTPEVTDAQRAAFRLAQADMHDRKAAEWEALGDEVQVQRWRASAASLRGEA